MKNLVKILLIVLMSASMACKSPLENNGPDLCPSADFNYEISSLNLAGMSASNEVNLSEGGLHINTQFTEVVEWTLRIVSDNATKVYTGESDSIDVWWSGNVDVFPLFSKGKARIELEIACKESLEKQFSITGDPNFKNLHPAYGVLLRDFDKNGFAPVAGSQFSNADGWAGVNGDSSYFNYYTENPSPLGGLYGELYAKAPNPIWYHGASSFPISDFSGSLATNNADSVYLNFFCKGYGLVNTGLEFALQSSGKTYFHTEPLLWEGWKFVSLKLSDLKILRGENAGRKFNDVDGINGCVMQLGSAPAESEEAKSAYDFIILTVGQPFVTN